MKDLDKKDLMLLDLLAQGSRGTAGRIAKKLKLHKNSVLYRIKRLRRMGVIEHFSFIPGLDEMGKSVFYVFFRLNTAPDEKKKIYSYLNKHPLALSVMRLSGKWNIMIELICDDLEAFNNELASITNFLGDRLSDYRTVLSHRPYKIEETINFELGYFKGPQYVKSAGIVPLDELDAKILGVLSDNSDLSYNEIASKTGTTADTVFYRVKKFIENGVIRKFVPVVDLEKLGFQNYLISLKLSSMTREKFTKLGNYLVNSKNIYYAFRTADELGIVMLCAYRTNAKLDAFLTDLTDTFSDIIREHDVLIINEKMKFDYFPKGLRFIH